MKINFWVIGTNKNKTYLGTCICYKLSLAIELYTEKISKDEGEELVYEILPD